MSDDKKPRAVGGVVEPYILDRCLFESPRDELFFGIDPGASGGDVVITGFMIKVAADRREIISILNMQERDTDE